MKDTYTVERKIHVDAPASAVYERIADFQRWPAWSPYEELDPDMDRTYAGAQSGVGAVYEWSGNLKAGAGRMEIVDAVDDGRVLIDQRNLKPFRSESTTTFALDDSGDRTAVTWSITGPVTLMTRIMGLFRSMDRMVGPLFERGLARLKADTEAA
jgi:carbon monoxide dehydrogenase subunit G